MGREGTCDQMRMLAPCNDDASSNARTMQPFVAALRNRHGKISCPPALQNKRRKQKGKEGLRFSGWG